MPISRRVFSQLFHCLHLRHENARKFSGRLARVFSSVVFQRRFHRAFYAAAHCAPPSSTANGFCRLPIFNYFELPKNSVPKAGAGSLTTPLAILVYVRFHVKSLFWAGEDFYRKKINQIAARATAAAASSDAIAFRRILLVQSKYFVVLSWARAEMIVSKFASTESLSPSNHNLVTSTNSDVGEFAALEEASRRLGAHYLQMGSSRATALHLHQKLVHNVDLIVHAVFLCRNEGGCLSHVCWQPTRRLPRDNQTGIT